MSSFYGIGLMSGSSLDGLDICYAEFTGDVDTDVWGYRILKCMTLPYSDEMSNRLKEAPGLSGFELIKLHVDYGRYLGETIEDFIDSEDAKPAFVASHGHTVFHRPQEHLAFQLGDGETTAAYLSCPLVCNFRNKDVALGGQGAPLVPDGERYLFGNVDVCVHLGGISTISLRGEKGYDVCGCNIVLNMLVTKYNNTTQDVDGKIGNTGTVLDEVLRQLEALEYYKQAPPKSMGIELIQEHIFPILDSSKYNIPDLLCTYSEHIAREITNACCAVISSPQPHSIRKSPTGKENMPVTVLLTGGGVLNRCTTDRLEEKFKAKNMVMAETDNETVLFKDALLIGFLGLRALLGLENVSCSITGSSTDSVCGSIHLPPKSYHHSLSAKSFKLPYNLKRTISESGP